MINIKELIEQSKRDMNIKNELAIAQYGKKYPYLKDDEKEQINEFFKLYKLEEDISNAKTFDDIASEVEYEYNRLKEHGILGESTGIDFKVDTGRGEVEFDKLFNGYIPGKVYTIAGYTNTGKSNLTYYMVAKYIKANPGKKIIFFNTEVSTRFVALNMIKAMYNISFKEAVKKIINKDKEVVDLFKNLVIYDDIIDIDDIDKVVKKGDYDMIIIDFVQGLRAKGLSGYDMNAYLGRKVQRIAIENNAILLSVAQLTASGTREQTKEGLFTIKGAGEFVESSDVVFALYRVPQGENNELIFKCTKNKFGGLFDFELDVDFSILDFKLA